MAETFAATSPSPHQEALGFSRDASLAQIDQLAKQAQMGIVIWMALSAGMAGLSLLSAAQFSSEISLLNWASKFAWLVISLIFLWRAVQALQSYQKAIIGVVRPFRWWKNYTARLIIISSLWGIAPLPLFPDWVPPFDDVANQLMPAIILQLSIIGIGFCVAFTHIQKIASFRAVLGGMLTIQGLFAISFMFMAATAKLFLALGVLIFAWLLIIGLWLFGHSMARRLQQAAHQLYPRRYF